MKTKPYLFSISSHPDAIHINSLSITLLQPEIDFSEYEYLILTSKQASQALKQYPFNSFKDKKALCISQATAESFEGIGGEVLEVGSGYGDSLSERIASYPHNTKWLYLRASIIASDFVSICREDGYSIEETIVYESECSQEILDIKIDKNDTLIFTSPSSVRCFLKNAQIFPTNKVIVIGSTTAKALPEDVVYRVSRERTIASCMKMLY